MSVLFPNSLPPRNDAYDVLFRYKAMNNSSVLMKVETKMAHIQNQKVTAEIYWIHNEGKGAYII